MSIKSRGIVFIFLTLAISWGSILFAQLNNRRSLMDAGIFVLLFGLGPALSALACTFMFEKGRRPDSLGIRFGANRWWIFAFLIPLLLIAASIGVIKLSFLPLLNFNGPAGPATDLQLKPPLDSVAHMAEFFLPRIAGFTVLAIGEELGWRGYLYYLWRSWGFWRASFAIGLVWGVWHSPLVYFYGLNYPDHPILGLFLFPVFTMSVASVYMLVRDEGRSIWPVAILHGVSNGLVPLMIFLCAASESRVVLSMNAVAVISSLVIFLSQRKQSLLYRISE